MILIIILRIKYNGFYKIGIFFFFKISLTLIFIYIIFLNNYFSLRNDSPFENYINLYILYKTINNLITIFIKQN